MSKCHSFSHHEHTSRGPLMPRWLRMQAWPRPPRTYTGEMEPLWVLKHETALLWSKRTMWMVCLMGPESCGKPFFPRFLWKQVQSVTLAYRADSTGLIYNCVLQHWLPHEGQTSVNRTPDLYLRGQDHVSQGHEKPGQTYWQSLSKYFSQLHSEALRADTLKVYLEQREENKVNPTLSHHAPTSIPQANACGMTMVPHLTTLVACWTAK